MQSYGQDHHTSYDFSRKKPDISRIITVISEHIP
jgi:hypothetical protein